MSATAAASPWLRRGFGALLVLAFAAITVAVIQGAAWREWNRVRQRAAAFAARLDATPGHRPVLIGAAAPGNSWTAYSRALALGKAVGSSVAAVDLQKIAGDLPEAALADVQVEAALESWAPAFAELRLGAQSGDGTLRVDWAKGFDADLPDAVAGMNLVVAAMASFRHLLAHGEPAAAVHRWLDALQFTRDEATVPALVPAMCSAVAVQSRLCSGLFVRSVLERLPAAPRKVLRDGVAAALSGWPVDTAHGGDVALLAATLEAKPMLLWEAGMAWPSWRHGFSSRLALAEHAHRLLDYADALARGSNWADVAPSYAALGVPHPGLSRMLWSPIMAGSPVRDAVVDLYLALAALVWLDDPTVAAVTPGPFGTSIERRDGAAEAEFTCVGATAKDHTLRVPRVPVSR